MAWLWSDSTIEDIAVTLDYSRIDKSGAKHCVLALAHDSVH